MGDRYMHLPDLLPYIDASARAEQDYTNPALWAKKTILNVARSGKFSSDRTIQEYARDVWTLAPVEPEDTLPGLGSSDEIGTVERPM
jgi:starch phosphorylase